MHAHYTARQTLQGSCWMFSASDPTLCYHIQCPKTFRTHIYAYCNQCNHNSPAGTMTILCMLTILLGKYCRGHAECSRPRAQHYSTIFDHRTHSGDKFIHPVVNAITIKQPEEWPLYACSLYCSANIAGVTLNVLGLGHNTIPPHSVPENIPDS